MVSRVIRDDGDLHRLLVLLRGKKKPFTVSIAQGVNRTLEQNKLQRLWLNEAAEQLGEPAEDLRGYCKLHFGVPILRNENDIWRDGYDRVVKPLPYEHKLIIMKEPFSFPVTSQMTTKQKTAYFEAMLKHFAELGVTLTDPRYGDERNV